MSTSGSFTALDWLAVGVDLVVAASLLAFAFLVAPNFASVLGDFGARSALPTITRLALSPWSGLTLGMLVATVTGLGAFLRGPELLGLRRALLVGGFFGGALGLAALLYAMYGPMFSLSEYAD